MSGWTEMLPNRFVRWIYPWTLLSLGLAPISLAHAKEVSLQWEKVPGATAYEVQVIKEKKSFREARVSLNQWKLDLPYGSYHYLIRAVDDLGRSGEWSETAPLIVMSPSPRPLVPGEDEKIPTYKATTSIRFGWEEIPGITKYRLVLRSGRKNLADQIINGTEALLTALPPGSYEWTVQAVISAEKKWESEPSESRDLKIVQEKLRTPRLISPIGEVSPPQGTNGVPFSWLPIGGVDDYEVCALKIKSTQKICDKVRKPLTHVLESPLTASLRLPEATGTYEWSVRPLLEGVDTDTSKAQDEVTFTSEAFSSAPILSQTQGAPTRNSLPGEGYIALSLIAAPYTYSFKSLLHDSYGKTASTLSTVRLSSEYWWRPKWGFAAAFERYSISIENQGFSASTYEFFLKSKYRVGEDGQSWVLMPKAGLELREMILVYPNINYEVQGTPLLETQRPNSVGASIGLDVRKAFWNSFSLGLKSSWHVPLLLLDGVPQSSTIQNRFQSSGLTLGAQVAYFPAQQRFGFAAGGLWDRRKTSYSVPIESDSARDPEEVEMTGLYLFLSGILRF